LVSDFHLLAAHLMQQVADRRVLGQVDAEGFQGDVGGRAVVVGDGAGGAGRVVGDQREDQVVHVLLVHLQIDAGGVGDGAFAVEVADAGVKQHHAGERQFHDGRGFGRLRVAGLGKIGKANRANVSPPRSRPARERMGGGSGEGYCDGDRGDSPKFVTPPTPPLVRRWRDGGVRW
jgi:hypothetical protein